MRRVSIWTFRGLVIVHTGLVLAQPVLAGLYLGGEYDALSAHQAVAGSVALAGLLQILGAVALLVGGGAWWPLPATVLIFLAEGLQIGMGYARVLTVHIPLGVGIVACSMLLAVWACRPVAARPRSRRTVGPVRPGPAVGPS